jgi:hypothetical protein
MNKHFTEKRMVIGKETLARINRILESNNQTPIDIHRLGRLSGKGTNHIVAVDEDGIIVGVAYYSLERDFSYTLAHIRVYVDQSYANYEQAFMWLLRNRIDAASTEEDHSQIGRKKRESLKEIQIREIEVDKHRHERRTIYLSLGFDFCSDGRYYIKLV